MLGAYSARLRAFDLVMEFLVGPPGARSDTAAAAAPMLGVDSRNRKKRSRALVFSPSRFLAFSIMLVRSAAAAQDDFLTAFRCVQAWLLEKLAAWADEDAPCLAAALMAQQPPCDMLRKRPCEGSRLSARTSALASRASMRSSSMKFSAAWSSAGGWTASTISSTESASSPAIRDVQVWPGRIAFLHGLGCQ